MEARFMIADDFLIDTLAEAMGDRGDLGDPPAGDGPDRKAWDARRRRYAEARALAEGHRAALTQAERVVDGVTTAVVVRKLEPSPSPILAGGRRNLAWSESLDNGDAIFYQYSAAANRVSSALVDREGE